jgi:hypothetical protein
MVTDTLMLKKTNISRSQSDGSKCTYKGPVFFSLLGALRFFLDFGVPVDPHTSSRILCSKFSPCNYIGRPKEMAT